MKSIRLFCITLLAVLSHGLSAQKFEAENFTLSGGAVKTACSSCSGGYMVAQQDGTLSYTFNASTTGYVDIYIMAQTTGGDKTNDLNLDGQVSQFVTNATAYTRSKIGTQVRLNSGSHTLKIVKNWGWINVDYIELVSVAGPVYNINSGLVTAGSTAEATKLYQFLKDNYGNKIISGVQEEADYTWLKTNTGKAPVLVGNDFLFCGRGYTWYNEQTPIDQAVNTYARNGIPTICWHWRDPSRATEEFYWQGAATTYTTFDVKQILTTGSTGYNQMISDIDYTAGLLKKIRDKNVPILWRPLHEAAGGWFWWGRDGAACKKLWQVMYDRLVNYHGIKNLIWVYTKQPNDDAFYPGDAYVDIVGRDYYDTGNHTSVVNEFTSISSKFGNKKMTTITECGSFPDPDNLTNDAAKWSWYMVWAGDFVRSSTYNSLDLWKKAFASSYVLTLDEMPNLKTYGGTTSTASVSNGTYQITFKHSGKSLAVENALTTDGANVIQNPYAGTNNEKWFVQDQGSGQYSIKNVNATGRGLDVVSSSTASPADINIWYYSGGNNQKFKIEAVGSYYRIVNVNSGKCIDMAGSSQNNVSIQQYDCNNADNQLFTFTKLNSNTSRVASEEEPNAELNTIVAPNPSENQFTITQSGAFTFGVYDVLGTVQEKGEGIDKAIFGKNLKTGMYILKVESEGKSKSIKVIKTQ